LAGIGREQRKESGRVHLPYLLCCDLIGFPSLIRPVRSSKIKQRIKFTYFEGGIVVKKLRIDRRKDVLLKAICYFPHTFFFSSTSIY